MKKEHLMIYSFVVIAILAVNLVSAQQVFSRTRAIFSDLYDNVIAPIFSFLLNDSSNSLSGEEFFAKVLLFIFLLVIVWTVVEKIPLFSNKTGVISTVSILFCILAIRYISDVSWIKGIILPYTVVGTAISTLLPLVAWIYFVYGSGVGPMTQRAMWIIAFVMFIGLYYSRADEIKDFAWIYGIAGVICLLGIFFNKWVNKAVHKMEWDKLDQAANQRMILELRRQLDEYHKDLTAGRITPIQYNSFRTDILLKIQYFSK